MPSITWIKNDDALAVQSYNWTRVAEIFLDDEQIHSQLVIKGVKREDDGKYYCFANNSAGEKASKPAFLSTKDPGETNALCFSMTNGLCTELCVLRICCVLIFIFHGLATVSKRSQGALVDK